MSTIRADAVNKQMPDDCSCTDGYPAVNLDAIIAMLGCRGCGGFAISLTASLDDLIDKLQTMRDTRDQGLAVVHPAGQVARVRQRTDVVPG